MSKRKELHPEVEQFQVRTWKQVEIGKRLPNGRWVVNYHKLYEAILLWSDDSSNPLTVNTLYKYFGMRGGWGRDTTVDLALHDMVRLNVIRIDNKHVIPLMGEAYARKLFPHYTTLEETLAGLHGVDEVL